MKTTTKEEVYSLLDSLFEDGSFQIFQTALVKRLNGSSLFSTRKIMTEICDDSLMDGKPYVVAKYINASDDAVYVVTDKFDHRMIMQ